jgi:Holliday junction resolvase RusA-like endonuclease
MILLEVTVPGAPVPQGSVHPFVTAAGPRARHDPRVREYRLRVAQAVRESRGSPPHLGPVEVLVVAWLPRPASHYGTGRNTGRLRPSAPALPTTKPDVDKLARVVLDALTDGGLWRDDAQVTGVRAVKRYADDEHPVGVLVRVLDPGR